MITRRAAQAAPSPFRAPFRNTFAVITLLLSAQAVYLSLLGGDTADSGAIQVHFPLFLSYAIAVVLLLLDPQRSWETIRRTNPLMLVLLGFCFVSYLWSAVPAITQRRNFALVGTFAIGWWIASRYDRRQQVRLVAVAAFVAAVASIGFAVLLPKYGLGRDIRGPYWIGAFTTKNALGRFAAFGVIVNVLAITTTRKHWERLFFVTSAGLLLFVALQSQAKVAILVIPTCLALLVLAAVIRSRRPIAPALTMIVLAGLIAVVVLVMLNWDGILEQLGRDSQLTDRTVLWASAWRAIQERPWLGYGYGGFWNSWNQPSSLVLIENPWGPPHSHNGVLDMWLNLGIVGVVLFITMLVDIARRALTVARSHPMVDALWPLTVVIFFVCFNVTEVTLMTFFFFSMLVTVSVGQPSRVTAPATRRRGADLPHVISV